MNIEEYLSHFDKFTKDPTLEAMEWIMNKFDNPHKKIKCIHIAGTNGKGSVSEMLNNCLINAGYKVGKFISPHLIKFNDGICINNEQITDKEVENILEPLSKVIEEYNKTHNTPVKWFEVITSLVFIYFYEKKCDFAVIEAGLGGITDCTNIVNPIVSIITTIGYDHVDILGKTLKSIAIHKAGIIKKNSNTVFINQPEIVDVIKKKCKSENNNLYLINPDEIKNYEYNDFFQKFDYKNYKEIEINLKGKVQTLNAAEVLETINILKNKGYNIPNEAILVGLKTVVHRARMEKIHDNPCIIFDGGHNESAIKNLKQNIKQCYNTQKKVFIISILETKDHSTIIKELAEEEDAIFYFTNGIPERPYVPANELFKEAKKYIKTNNLYERTLEEAIKEAEERYTTRVIFVIGSFYVYKKVIDIIKR